jgi:peptide/nickel transport system permease protein
MHYRLETGSRKGVVWVVIMGNAAIMKRKIARHLVAILVTMLLGTFAAATLVRLAPGFDIDTQQLDSRLSHDSVEALRSKRAENSNILHFYFSYLRGAAHGDFGNSLDLNQPVRDLIVARSPATLRLAGLGLLLGWLLAGGLAFSAALFRSNAYEAAASTTSGALLCIPSAVMALAFVLFHAPAQFAVALIVFPRLFRYVRNVLGQSYQMQHVTTARAKGLGPVRILFFHVLPVSTAPLIALAGVSVSIALGAAVPVEALCGIPGIGQLAWQAALGRDLPLLVTLTALVTLVTLTANTVSDLVSYSVGPHAT